MVSKLKEYANDFGIVDPLPYNYQKGISITKLAGDNNVSRQAIIKRLKKLGLHKSKEKELADKNIINFIEVHPNYNFKCTEYVEKNIYTHSSNPNHIDHYLLKIYQKGKFYEKYYATLEHARNAREFYRTNIIPEDELEIFNQVIVTN